MIKRRIALFLFNNVFLFLSLFVFSIVIASSKELRNSIIDLAINQIGKNYVSGAEGPDNFDCSGLVFYVYKENGFDIPRYLARQFYEQSEEIENGADAYPGDFVFLKDIQGTVYHIGIYIGDGKIVAAASYELGVDKENLSYWEKLNDYGGIRRLKANYWPNNDNGYNLDPQSQKVESKPLETKNNESWWQKIVDFFSKIFQFPNSATITQGLPADQKIEVKETKKIAQTVVVPEIKENKNDLPKETLKKEENLNIENSPKDSKPDSENKSKEGQSQTSTVPSVSAILPSGKIAYISSRDGNQEIYSINSQTGKEINLTNNSSNDWDPAYSPDGAKIAFVSNRSGINKVYTMNANGDNVKEITEGQYPSWFPNGAKIIFSQLIESNDKDAWGNPGVKYFRLYTINADGTHQQELAIDPAISQKDVSFEKYHYIEPAVSPDGTKIAFSGGNCEYGDDHNLYVVDINSRFLEKYERPAPYQAGPHDLYNPAWSPDGKNLIFVAYNDYLPDIAMDYAGGARKWLYFGFGSRATEQHEIWKKVFSDSQLIKIGNGDYPVYSPDGSYMAYVKSDNNIYIMDLNREISQKLTTTGNNWSPVWVK